MSAVQRTASNQESAHEQLTMPMALHVLHRTGLKHVTDWSYTEYVDAAAGNLRTTDAQDRPLDASQFGIVRSARVTADDAR